MLPFPQNILCYVTLIENGTEKVILVGKMNCTMRESRVELYI